MEAYILAEVGEEFGVAITPLFEQHEQDGVERTVLVRDRVIDVVHDVLEALRSDPDKETASSTDVISSRLDEVISKNLIAVCRQLERSLDITS